MEVAHTKVMIVLHLTVHLCSSSQGLVKVSFDIVDMFDSYGHPNHVFGNTRLELLLISELYSRNSNTAAAT